MADVNAESAASCGQCKATEAMTDCDCSASKLKQDVREKRAHKNGSLPNGCLKYALEENGLVKLVEKAEDARENTSNMEVRDVGVEDSSCEQRVVAHACDSVEDNNPDTNVKNVSELFHSQHVDLDGCTDAIAKVNIIESEIPPSENVPVAICSDLGVEGDLDYVVYESEVQMPDIMKLITKDLSEPYSIYTYRYFIHNWPKLCFLAMDRGRCVGAIVCKLDMHKKMVRRGYIAMLAVDQNYRRRGIGSHLVMKAIRAMVADECDEVVLETEITNKAALRLYENLGFVRDKRLFRYYLNGVDALRLKLWLR